MKIKSADVMLKPYVRDEAAKHLNAGNSVFITAPSDHEASNVSAIPYPSVVTGHIEAGRTAIRKVNVDARIREEWNLPGLVIGGGVGAVIGAGVGILLDQLKVVHPASAVAFEAACAMIGSGIGGGVGSRTFQFEFTREPNGKLGVKIQPA